MSRVRPIVSILLLSLALGLSHAQNFESKLKALPRVLKVEAMKGRANTYDVTFEQPVDHKNPGGPKFGQHLFIVHNGFDKPNVLHTEGYASGGPSGGELRAMLGTPNLVTVEHRYFGRSVPSPIVWEQLTIKNAADDMHDIVVALKKLYTGPWVSMGASKGGQTALFYKCYYPDDVNATVAYVAPINVNVEDPRIMRFFESVGTKEDRDKIKAYQIAMLKREPEVLPLMGMDPKNFSIGVAKAYELCVLEYPFIMWQYGTKPQGVPAPDAPASELAAALKKVNVTFFYSDAGIAAFGPFFWQAYSEIGYYNYDITDFKPFLKADPNPTNMVLCPTGTQSKVKYNPATLAYVYDFLRYKAHNVVYIYGETDPWTASQVELIGRTNALKFLIQGAWHNASIGLGSSMQKTQFFDAMDQWMGVKLIRS